MDHYIFQTILLLLLLIIISINCYYIKHQLNQKNILPFNNIKIAKNNELKEIDIKNSTCYYFDDIILIILILIIFYWMKNHMKKF